MNATRSFARPELEPREFDVCGPLPTGVTVLEASAGTGKTYTIAALAARYVAEGVPLERLLLVTFTRIATGELRERVRERLVSVEQGLARALAGVLHGGDPVVSLLATGSEREVSARRERLARAVASFDAATIATTHGFCQEILGGLGIAGDLEPDVSFVEDLSELVGDVVDDLYIRRFFRGEAPAFGRAQAADIARVAIENPGAQIVTGTCAAQQMRGRLAEAVRAEFELRKRRLSVMTYDDLVMRLRTALAGPGGPATAAQLRHRYQVVLVDEFQDTDPAQWDIMRSAFADTGVTLVLIADPKQAIYAFRGADVYAYLEAAAQRRRPGHARRQLAQRPGADRCPRRAAGRGQARPRGDRLSPGPRGARRTSALGCPARRHRRRCASAWWCATTPVSLTPGGYARNASARDHICRDLAAQVVALLDVGARYRGARADRRSHRPSRGLPGSSGRAGAHQPPRRDGARSALRRRRAGCHQRRRQRLRHRHGARLAGAAGGPRTARLEPARPRRGVDPVPGLGRRAPGPLRGRRLGVGGGPPAPARLGPGAAAARRRRDARDGHSDRGAAGAGAGRRGRRAAPDRPAPRRAAAPCRGRPGADGSDRAHRLAAHPDRRGRQPTPPTRSAAGAWSPTPRPSRCSPSIAARASSSRSSTCRSCGSPAYIPKEPRPVFFHDPGGRRRAHDRRRAWRARSTRSTAARTNASSAARISGSPTWRSPAPATRPSSGGPGSWDSRNSPLGRLLFCRDDEGNIADFGSFTPIDAAVARAAADGRRAAPRAASPSSRRGWRRRPRGSPPLPARRVDWRHPASTAASICAGDGRPTRTSPRPATTPGWRSEPEQPLISDEPEAPDAGPGGPSADLRPDAAAIALAAGVDARRRRRSGRSCTGCSRPPSSPPPTSTPSWPRRSRRSRAAEPSTSAIRRVLAAGPALR